MIIRLIFILLLSVLHVGCVTSEHSGEFPTTSPPPPPPPPPPSDGTRWTRTYDPNGNVVEVFYGSNRNVISRNETKVEFGSKRSSKVSYGRCLITIPPNHEIGVIERPWFSWFAPNPEDHMVLAINRSYGSFKEMSNEIRRKPGKKMFVFIHGYNVKFNDAALRTGQMARDLQFDGAPIFFSWPAIGSTALYTGDENNIEWTTPYIKNFIEQLIKDVPDKDLYIIAHSMGTRGLTRALKDIVKENPKATNRIKEVILAAPDIDSDVFKEQIMPAFDKSKLPLTIYASDKDKALKLSSFLHGYLRVGSGFSGKGNLEVVDATEGDTDFLGHSYFAQNVRLLSDMFHIITDHKRASERYGLEKISTDTGVYWRLKPSN